MSIRVYAVCSLNVLMSNSAKLKDIQFILKLNCLYQSKCFKTEMFFSLKNCIAAHLQYILLEFKDLFWSILCLLDPDKLVLCLKPFKWIQLKILKGSLWNFLVNQQHIVWIHEV